MKNVLLVSALSLIGSLVFIHPTFSFMSTKQPDSFMSCYTENAIFLEMASGFVPFSYDMKDPKMKNFLSGFCKFYYDKTGEWPLISEYNENPILQKYTEEYGAQLTMDDLPDGLFDSYLPYQ